MLQLVVETKFPAGLHTLLTPLTPTPRHNPPPILAHILPLSAGAGDGSAAAASDSSQEVCAAPPLLLAPPPFNKVCILPPCALMGVGSAVAAPGGSDRVLGRRDD